MRETLNINFGIENHLAIRKVLAPSTSTYEVFSGTQSTKASRSLYLHELLDSTFAEIELFLELFFSTFVIPSRIDG